VQEKIREGMKSWKIGDWYIDNEGNILCIEYADPINIWEKMNNSRYKKFIRLPQVHDWQDPERGLWEWVDWDRFDVDAQYMKGKIFVYESINEQRDNWSSGWYSPEIALIKALMWQWEIEEVKE